MTIELGTIRELFRYPVKSMAGVPVIAAQLGLHGLVGDRRFGFRRVGDTSSFPWLSASRLPALVTFQPVAGDGEFVPASVRTPEGEYVALEGDALREDIGRRFGSPVELMQLKHGIFDEASVSVISVATILGIERTCGRTLDRLRFRPNVVLETTDERPFREDAWVGGTLIFGEADGAAVAVTLRDERCMMVNLDPATGEQDASVMKAIVGLNGNCAGVYGAVVRPGALEVGMPVRLVSGTLPGSRSVPG